MRRKLGRLALAVGVVFAVLGLAPTGALGGAVRVTLVPYLDSGYTYKVVSHDEGAGFELPGFDDSDFEVGDAGFGTSPAGCVLNTPEYVKTPWPGDTDILLRKIFDLPPGATGVRVAVAIDNDVQIFVNGQDVSGGLQTHENCASRDDFVFNVPDALVGTGPNLLAVRGRDRGEPAYLDVRVTAAVSIDQVPLRRTARVGEFLPAGDDGYLAWTQITRARPNREIAYVKPNGESPIRLNAAGTEGALGGIDGGTLVYQQFHPTKYQSDLRLFDLATRQRSTPPRGVNTRRWEYLPSISGDWLLFGRHRRDGTRDIVLHNMVSGNKRLLSRTPRDIFAAPGQVNGSYAVWEGCTDSGCSIGLHDIAADTTQFIPNVRPWQFGASVAEDGTVFFEREGNSCKSRGQLVAYPLGGPAVVLVKFREGQGGFFSYAYTDVEDTVHVLYARGRQCRSVLTDDLYKVVIPDPLATAAESRLSGLGVDAVREPVSSALSTCSPPARAAFKTAALLNRSGFATGIDYKLSRSEAIQVMPARRSSCSRFQVGREQAGEIDLINQSDSQEEGRDT